MAKLPDWADSFLNIQQSMRAEQVSQGVDANARQFNALEKQLSELDEKIGFARQDRAQQAALRQMLFTYRQVVDRAADEKNAFSSYVHLKSAELYIENVDTAEIEELNDKEYHAETAKRLNRALADLQQSVGTSVFAILESLNSRLREIDQLRKRLSAEKIRHEGKLTLDNPQFAKITTLLEKVNREAGGSPTFGSDVMRLAGMIEAARSLAAQLPDFSWDATEFGKLLDAGLIGLVRPYRMGIFLLKCMALLAKCDGAISTTERGFIVATAAKSLSG